MKTRYLFFLLLVISLRTAAQSPMIDYSFLAVPPGVVVNSIVEQPDGKILVGGFFMNYAGSGKNHLVRLNHDGTLDSTFNTVSSGPDNAVEEIELMSDGRMVIAGNFTQYNGTNCYFVARLLANGSIDNTFSIPPGVINGAVKAIEIHTGNKVIAGGEFFTCYGHSQPHITRFNYDGSLDTTFNIGTGFDQNVYDLQVLPDARILVAGKFVSYNGNSCGNIALLTSGGPYDVTMDNNPGFSGTGSAAYDLELQADGKILVGGSFNYHNGTLLTGLARLNIDGTRDLGFTPPFYPYALIRAIAVQADNRIVVGGDFTNAMYNPGITGPNRIARLQASGVIDTTFDVGTGIPSSSAYVNDITIEADHRILVGGLFDSFDTETMYQQIIRLNEDVAQSVEELQGAKALNIYPNPSEGSITLEDPSGHGGLFVLTIYSSAGQKIIEKTLSAAPGGRIILDEDLSRGIYLLRAVQDDKQFAVKLIVQ